MSKDKKQNGKVENPTNTENQEAVLDNQNGTGTTEPTDGTTQGAPVPTPPVDENITPTPPDENGGGGQKIDSEGADLDTENQAATNGAAGAETTDTVVDEPTEKTEKRAKIAASVFAQNSLKSVLHFTSDLIPFFEKSDAFAHANSLDDKTVVTLNKE
jgi:hypothetical protein